MNRRLIIAMTLPVLWAGRVYGEPKHEVAFVSKNCEPTAILSGEPDLVSSLANELSMLGVASLPTPGCPAVTASVKRGPDGVIISLREPNGRHVTRSLSDFRISATWIDSWLHEDLGAPLLAARLLPTTASNVRSEKPLSVPASVPDSRRYQATLGYESIQRDGTAWQGARADLCTALGPTCVGMQVALAQMASDNSLSDEFFRFSERSADLLAVVHLPIELGQTILSPHVALGAGWFETSRDIPDCLLDEATEECPPSPQPLDVDNAHRRTWAPQGDLGLGLSLPILGALHLELGGAVGYRLFAAPAEYLELESEPECPGPQDPACESEPELLSFADEPSTSWRLFIGLQVQL